MKKRFLLLLTTILVFTASVDKGNAVKAKAAIKINPISTKPLTDLFDYRPFVKDFSRYENKTVAGKQYKNGVRQHRQSISYGDFRLVASEIEKITSTYQVGILQNPLTITDTTTYQVINSVSTTKEVKVGITQMAEATVKLFDVASVGTSTQMTTEFSLSQTKYYSETVSKTREIIQSFDLDKIASGKTAFSVSRMGIYYELDVKKSCTQWEFLGWHDYSDTLVTSYKVRYYLFDIITFAYSDGTFGTKDAIYSTNMSVEL